MSPSRRASTTKPGTRRSWTAPQSPSAALVDLLRRGVDRDLLTDGCHEKSLLVCRLSWRRKNDSGTLHRACLAEIGLGRPHHRPRPKTARLRALRRSYWRHGRGLRGALQGPGQPRPSLRRRVFRGRDVDRDLLPAELPGDDAAALSNVRFFATAAAAQQAGFRACLRCRPHAAPGSPHRNSAGRTSPARALALITRLLSVDREGVAGVAKRRSPIGAPPPPPSSPSPAPARWPWPGRSGRRRRCLLIETRRLPIATSRYAGAGFASRPPVQRDVRAVFARTPIELRQKRRRRGEGCRRRRAVIRCACPTGGPLDGPPCSPTWRPARRPGVEEVLRRRDLPPRTCASARPGTPSWRRAHERRVGADFDSRTCAAPRRRRSPLPAPAAGSTPIRSPSTRAGRGPPARPARGDDARDGGPRRGGRRRVCVRARHRPAGLRRGARTSAGKLAEALGSGSLAADGGLSRLFPSAEAVAEADPAVFTGPESGARRCVCWPAPGRGRDRARPRGRPGRGPVPG